MLTLGVICQLSAQKTFQQSYGITFISTHTQQQTFTYQPYQRPAYDILTPKLFTNFMTLSFHPRFNIKSQINSGFSIGAPIAISAFAEISSSNNVFKEKKNYLLLSLPIVAEWAWGYRAQRAFVEQKIGAFAYVGGALTLGRGTVGEFTNVNPYAGAGLRFKINERIGFEMSYSQNFITVLHPHPSAVFEDILPNFMGGGYGIADFNAKDRRATKTFQIGLSYH